MRAATRAKRLLSNLLRRDRIETELDDELSTWVNELTDRYVDRGLSREEPGARRSSKRGASK